MKYFSVADNRRLWRSALAALLLHAVVVAALSIFIAVNGAPAAEHIGMITLTLDEALPPGPASPVSALRDEARAPVPAPSVKPRADGPKVAAVNTPAPKTAVTVVEKTKANTAATRTEANGTIREPASGNKDEVAAKAEVAVKTEAPPSQLERGSLSRLDALLKDSGGDGTGNGTGGGGEGGGGGGSRAATSWEDRAVRELVSQAAPVIPRWVSEQGLRLKVELAVELNADGLVFVRNVKISSGYPDVDAAVAKAVSRWKYSRGAGTQSVRGTITYFIELK